MSHATKQNPEGQLKEKREIRFPGICADAKKLRCHRATLFRVLTGEWKLPGLLGRYNKLKNEQSSRN